MRRIRATLNKRAVLVLGQWFLFSTNPAIAGFVAGQVDFTGSLQRITTYASDGNSDLAPYFSIGDKVTGTLTYLTTGELAFANSDYANYWYSLQSISISVGPFTASSGAPTADPWEHRVQVVDNEVSGGVARDALIFSGRGGFSAGIAGLALFNLQFALGSFDLSTLMSKQLPSPDTVNTLSDIFRGDTNFIAFDGGGALRYNVDTFHAYVVPEPNTFVLLCLSVPVIWAFCGDRQNLPVHRAS